MERFFSKVNPIVHNRNLIKDSIIVEEKAEAFQLKKAERLKESRELYPFGPCIPPHPDWAAQAFAILLVVLYP